MDSTLTKGDVDTVIETEITQSDVLNIPDLRSEVCRVLTEQSEGNFLWIKLMVGHLNKSVGVADAFERLHNLPRDLQTAYETLLYGLVGRLERSELNLAQKVFAFIIVCQRPLSLDEFQYLLAANAMSKPTCRENSLEDYLIPRPDRKILDVCGGLVNIIGDHLRLVHFSVMEFLIRPESQWSHSRRSRKIKQFRVPLKQAHGWIAAASIECLETWYYSSQTLDWTKSPQLVEHNQFLGYSSKYSVTHITQSDIKPGVIAAKIDKFLRSDRCVPWIEHLIMVMIDDGSLDSQFMEAEKFMSWLGEAGHSLGLPQRVQTCLNHEIDRRSQQYGRDDSRTERIRLFLGVVQDELLSTGLQAVEPSLVGIVGPPTDISSILQILRNETPLSLELKANLLLKLQLYLQKVKRLTDPLQVMFRVLLEKASDLPTHALLIVGDFYLRLEKFEQALEIYFAALDKLEESEVLLKYWVVHQIGYAYLYLREYNKALEYFIRALAGDEKILGPKHIDTLTTIHNIGVAYNGLGQHDKATECFTRSLAGEEEEIIGPGYEDTLPTVNNIYNAYDSLEQYDIPLDDLIQTLSGQEKKVSRPERKKTKVVQKLLGVIRRNFQR
ncbi:hypothetical protein ACHAO4_008931 [Trichoderma viride]